MPLSPDIVDSVTIITAASPQLPGDNPIIGVQLTGPQATAWDASIYAGELIVSVTQSTWQAVLALLGFVDGDPLYEELETGFAADEVPEIVLIGREAVPVPQVVNFDLGDAGAAADGNYTITLASAGETTDFTHAAAAETRAQVVTALIALIDADPLYGAVNGADAEQIDVTAANAGISFSFATAAPSPEVWLSSITTPNTGLSTDLAAWEAERSDWYFVTELSLDPLVNRSMAGPVAAHPRDIVFVSRVSLATDPNATTDTDERAAAYITTSQRTGVAYVPSGTDHDLAAHYFRLLPTDPGEYTWTNVELRPIDGDTYDALQTRALRGLDTDPGQYWYYEALPTRSFGVSRNARMGDGTKFEFVRDRDYLNNQIIVDVSNAIIDSPKIPYTDPGAAEITGVIRGRLQRSVTAGIIVQGFTISTTPRADQVPADIAAGVWRGWTWEATLAGSIDAVTIRGTLFIV
jgi:hypothetical protein